MIRSGNDPAGSLTLPNFIIAGVMKAGTTSLYTYLAQHPDMAASSIKETTFFRPYYEPEPGVDPEALSLVDYARFFEGAGDAQVIFESTPGYINGGERLARRLAGDLPGLRVLFVLREPVDRARSYLEFQKGLLNLPKTLDFDGYVSACLEQERRHGKPDWPHRGLWGGRYAALLREWHGVFGERMRVAFFDDLKHDPHAFTDNVCRWLGVRGVDEAPIDFSVENVTRLPANDTVHRIALDFNKRFEVFFRRHHWLKKSLRTVYFALNGTPKGPRGVDDATAARDYFREPNAMLKAFLEQTQPDTGLPAWLSARPEAASPVVSAVGDVHAAVR